MTETTKEYWSAPTLNLGFLVGANSKKEAEGIIIDILNEILDRDYGDRVILSDWDFDTKDKTHELM